jgi:hypothetical protein
VTSSSFKNSALTNGILLQRIWSIKHDIKYSFTLKAANVSKGRKLQMLGAFHKENSL